MQEKDQDPDNSMIPARVYLEIGHARTFAVALDWPGWSRSGRDEASALQALVDYGPRYGRVVNEAQGMFRAPAAAADLLVMERLSGNATTDFGAPNLASSTDAQPIDAAELQRWQTVLTACWKAFDAAVQAAEGKNLRKGPRAAAGT